MPLKNLHLTLVFLGEQSVEVLEEVAQIMLSIRAQAQPLKISFERLCLAGQGSGKRPVCLEVRAETPLLKLQDCLRSEIRGHGVDFKQNRFWPHLTLGRVQSPRASKNIQQCPAIGRKVMIDRVNLYRSRLLPEGAEHSLLREAKLQA